MGLITVEDVRARFEAHDAKSDDPVLTDLADGIAPEVWPMLEEEGYDVGAAFTIGVELGREAERASRSESSL